VQTGIFSIRLEGQVFADNEHFKAILKYKTRGEEVELLIMRNGEQKKLTVKLGEK